MGLGLIISTIGEFIVLFVIAVIVIVFFVVGVVKGAMQNVIAADAIIAAVAVFFLLRNAGLHTVFSIILALVAGGIFVGLTMIPYFGKPFVIVCGLCWAFGLYQVIDDFGIFHKLNNADCSGHSHILTDLLKNDPVWWWTIVILMVIVYVGVHLKCVLIGKVSKRTEIVWQEPPRPQTIPKEGASRTSQISGIDEQSGNQRPLGEDNELEDIDLLPEDMLPYDISESHNDLTKL